MKSKGFTLIETLINLALAVFLISGTVELMLRAAYLKKKSDILSASAVLAATKLETLRALPFNDEGLAEGVYEETTRDPSTERLFHLTWTVEQAGEAVKQIVVRVLPAQSAERGTELVLLVARSLGF